MSSEELVLLPATRQAHRGSRRSDNRCACPTIRRRMIASAEPVILLHGLWMRGYAMVLLARRLRAVGFAPEIIEYFTLFNTPSVGAERVRQRMLRHCDRPVHLVGHSLGGLVSLLATAQDAPE